MTTAEHSTVESVTGDRDALIGRLFETTVGAMDLLAIYLGDQLGLYAALAGNGPQTSTELAECTGINERYAREWLEQQAVTGLLNASNSTNAMQRTYSLPTGHAEVLLDDTSMAYFAPLAKALVHISSQAPALVKAYKTGSGVAWSDFNVSDVQAALNRPAFMHLLGGTWLPGLPEVYARLQADPPARVADVGCGYGWSSIAIAEAFPKVTVDGFDPDTVANEQGTRNIAAAGLSDRVRLHAVDAAAADGQFDLITAFECIHDVSNPVAILRTMREKLAPGGTALVVDERVGEAFSAPGELIERFCYGSSISLCLPAGMTETPSAGTGAVMRPSTLRQYAQEAGFSDIEILPIEHDLFRFYRLVV